MCGDSLLRMFSVCYACVNACRDYIVKLGAEFPVNSLQTNQGVLKLKNFKDKIIVIYFYPKDATPGCTIEANEFSSLHSKFVEHDSLILGASKDTLESHQKFCEKQKISFPLIVDQDAKLCKAFAVLKEKTIFGKKLFAMVERSTFVFNKQHVLVKEWRNVSAIGHASEVLSFVQQLAIVDHSN